MPTLIRDSAMNLSILLPVLTATIMSMSTVLAPDTEIHTYSVDTAHSNVGFKVKHLGILNVNGRFESYDATVSVDRNDLSTLQATARIRVASIDTGIQRRDDHLRSADFFDAANHPDMTFVSREVRNVDGNSFDLVGDLTIRGTTREIVLRSQFLGTAEFMGGERVALEARGEIDRFEYGLHWNAVTEAGGLVVSPKVEIILEIQAAAN